MFQYVFILVHMFQYVLYKPICCNMFYINPYVYIYQYVSICFIQTHMFQCVLYKPICFYMFYINLYVSICFI